LRVSAVLAGMETQLLDCRCLPLSQKRLENLLIGADNNLRVISKT